MTPTELRDYLGVLRDARLMSFHVKLGADEIAGTFEPETPSPDPVNVAGGWKGPERLDKFDDEPSLPAPQQG